MDADPQPERFYAGEFRHSIDDKNRITIPSRWRRDRPEEFILLPEATHQFLLVMSPKEFAKTSSDAEQSESVSVGNRGRFEIWNLQRWKGAHEEETATYQNVAREIGL